MAEYDTYEKRKTSFEAARSQWEMKRVLREIKRAAANTTHAVNASDGDVCDELHELLEQKAIAAEHRDRVINFLIDPNKNEVPDFALRGVCVRDPCGR